MLSLLSSVVLSSVFSSSVVAVLKDLRTPKVAVGKKLGASTEKYRMVTKPNKTSDDKNKTVLLVALVTIIAVVVVV